MKRKRRLAKSKKIQPETIIIKVENLSESEGFDEEIIPQNDDAPEPEVKAEQSSEAESEGFQNLSEDPNDEDRNEKNLEIKVEEQDLESEDNSFPDDSNDGDEASYDGGSNGRTEVKEEQDSGSDEFQDSSENSDDDDESTDGKRVKTGSYPCLLCGSVFRRRMILHKHQRKAHTIKTETGKLVVLRVKCSYPNCTQQFTGNNPRRIHEAHVHSDPQPTSCPEEGCGKTFKSKGSFRSHFRRFHTYTHKRHTCNICYKEFKEIGKLKAHIATHLSEVDRRKFQCEFCEKSYLKKTSLKEHKLTDHRDALGGKVTLLKCTFSGCPKTFPSIARRNNHVKVVHCAVKSFKCDVADCSKTFAQKGHLTRHVESCHRPEDSKPVICTVGGCFKSFKNPEGLRYHIKHRHEKPRTIIFQECGECGEQFVFQKQLSLHMKKCHEGNPCTLCGKRLANMNSLRAHMKRVHTGKKQFKCSLCKKAYLFEYERAVHMKTHDLESCLPCYFCSRRFSKKVNLFNHMNGIHLKERLHKCPEPTCRYSTVSKTYCKIHYETQHMQKGK